MQTAIGTEDSRDRAWAMLVRRNPRLATERPGLTGRGARQLFEAGWRLAVEDMEKRDFEKNFIDNLFGFNRK